ncbi:MAG: NADH:ubiquinone reductase (Na(+)-transporting) subunit C [Bacteroidales bacterium]|nr:NADH:ubiquinone reductase (Na(+)-transporting) subunit C [Bacteroidales bacterium]MDD6669600.1 NADH:ubiquinone reductase (Na(+)-transporting) subunit C [Bacteroidales bacterium]
MNKQGNTYTIIYITALVCVVGAVLAWVSLALKPKQDENVRVDKMQQMLSSIRVPSEKDNAIALYEQYVKDSYVVNVGGERIDGDAFSIEMSSEIKKEQSQRRLPVFVCEVEGTTKYILPVYGAGLWGPIWGYVSLNADGNTIYGAYFSHQGETPGLGAEIAKPKFSDQFRGKMLFKDGEFKSVAVLKKGQKPAGGEDYVDAITGGTITSRGVQSMIMSCLSDYQEFLKDLQNDKK